MPNEPIPKEPLAQRGSTTAGKATQRSGSVRMATPVLDPAARGSDDKASAGRPGGDSGFRSAIFRARNEASDGQGSAGRVVDPPLRPRRERKTPGPAEEEQWVHKSQANEIRWLNTKIEELERRLQRRKMVSVGAVALGGLALIAAIAFGIESSQPPQSVVAEIAATSSGETPRDPPPAAEEPGQASKAVPLQTDPTQATPQTVVGKPAPDRPGRDEQAAEMRSSPARPAVAGRTSPAEPAATGVASTAGEPGREDGTQALPIGPRADAATMSTAPAPGPDAEPWQLEAEQALMALIERGPAASPSRGGSEPAVEIPDLLSTPRRLEIDPEGSPEDASQDPEPYAATAAVNLRESPSTEAEVLTVVDEGDRVRRLGSEGDWLLVEYDNRGAGTVTGWVYGRFLRRAEGAAQGDEASSARSG